MEFVLFVVVVVAVVTVAVILANRSDAQREQAAFRLRLDQTTKMMEQLRPLWAAVGPFRTGDESVRGWEVALRVHQNRAGEAGEEDTIEQMVLEAWQKNQLRIEFDGDREHWESERRRILAEHPPTEKDQSDISQAVQQIIDENRHLESAAKQAGIMPNFSDNAGAFESALRVRWGNTWFSPDRREISPAELQDAQLRDQRDADDLKRVFDAALDEIAALGSRIDWSAAMDLRERLEAIVERAAQVGGSATRIGDQAESLRSKLINSAAEGLSPDALERLRRANEFHEFRSAIELDPKIAQLFRKDGPARQDPSGEMLLYLFSFDEPTLRKALLLIKDRQALASAYSEAKQAIQRAAEANEEVRNGKMVINVLSEALLELINENPDTKLR